MPIEFWGVIMVIVAAGIAYTALVWLTRRPAGRRTGLRLIVLTVGKDNA